MTKIINFVNHTLYCVDLKFIDNFIHRNELGASVCVFKDGEKVEFTEIVKEREFRLQSASTVGGDKLLLKYI